MAARKTRRKPTKSLKPRPQKVRLRLCPQLTQGEVRGLKARAVADMRPVGRTVALLLIEDLRRRGSGRSRRASGVSLGAKRSGYEITVPLTAEQRRKVEARAREELRSVSSYVAMLIVADLRRG